MILRSRLNGPGSDTVEVVDRSAVPVCPGFHTTTATPIHGSISNTVLGLYLTPFFRYSRICREKSMKAAKSGGTDTESVATRTPERAATEFSAPSVHRIRYRMIIPPEMPPAAPG
jgi:hypothetical protein